MEHLYNSTACSKFSHMHLSLKALPVLPVSCNLSTGYLFNNEYYKLSPITFNVQSTLHPVHPTSVNYFVKILQPEPSALLACLHSSSHRHGSHSPIVPSQFTYQMAKVCHSDTLYKLKNSLKTHIFDRSFCCTLWPKTSVPYDIMVLYQFHRMATYSIYSAWKHIWPECK